LFAFCDLHASRWRERIVTSPLELALPRYYDRQGFPLQAEDPDDLESHVGRPGWMLPMLTWAMKMEDPAYKRVAEDDFPDGSWLSTVWLGLDYNLFGGPPLIFETMYFAGRNERTILPSGVALDTPPSLEFPDPETGELTEQLRYTTEEEAAATHREVARRLRKRWEV